MRKVFLTLLRVNTKHKGNNTFTTSHPHDTAMRAPVRGPPLGLDVPDDEAAVDARGGDLAGAVGLVVELWLGFRS